MMNALPYTMDIKYTYSFVMQDCSEGNLSAALSNNGSTSFVNFVILLEKPIACQKLLYFPV